MEHLRNFSALQRAEIAEIYDARQRNQRVEISVLFNEPKLLKC